MRAGNVVEFCNLTPPIEGIGVRQAMHQRRHPPRESLRLPDAAQADRGVSIQSGKRARAIEVRQPLRQNLHVGEREVHPLRSSGRYDMNRVARQIEPAKLHRFGYEAPHRRDTLLRDRPDVRLPSVVATQPFHQLGPDAIIRPILDVGVVVALKVEPGHSRRTHAEQRETSVAVHVHQLVLRGRRVGQNPKPRERIHAFIRRQHAGRHRRSADPVEAVATRNKVAGQRVRCALAIELNARMIARKTMQGNSIDLEQDWNLLLLCSSDEILHNLMLPIDHHGLADQLLEVEMLPFVAKAKLDASMSKPFAMHPFAESEPVDQIDRTLLQHTGPDAGFAVIAAAGFEDDALNPRSVQQVSQRQPRRTGSDNANLCPANHGQEPSSHDPLAKRPQ